MPTRRSALVRKASWVFGGAALAFVLLWKLRGPLLRGAAQLWLVDTPLEKADAIVVLGGSLENRTTTAVKLQKEGWAARILIFDSEPSPSEKLGLSRRHVEVVYESLLRFGAKPETIHVIGKHVTSTRDEASAVRDWLLSSGANRVIVPTEFPSSRRTRWIFNRTLEGTQKRAAVYAIDSWDYNSTNWWQREQGLITMQNEFIKLLYYRLKY